jgi:hypothetical protein
MWSIEKIAMRNSDQPKRLDTILQTQSASEDLLCDTANRLEDGFSPQVCCFAQLPFAVAVDPKQSFDLPAGRHGGSVTLSFSRQQARLARDNKIELVDVPSEFNESGSGYLTQVRAFFNLWGRHKRDYENYLQCQSDSGLINQPLNSSLWNRKRAPAGIAVGPIQADDTRNAFYFEEQATDAVTHEIIHVLKIWLDNYTMVALDDHVQIERLCGLFVMLAPGRIRYSEPPLPVVPEILSHSRVPAEVDTEILKKALLFGRREFDRYLRQLVAMQRLAINGEPEIAIVGCQTAIEWYLNSFLEKQEVDANGRVRSLSVVRCLDKKPFRDFPLELKLRLKLITEKRNDIVHGGPPNRLEMVHKGAPIPTIAEVAQVALDLYKEMQNRLRKDSTLGARTTPTL